MVGKQGRCVPIEWVFFKFEAIMSRIESRGTYSISKDGLRYSKIAYIKFGTTTY